MRREFKGDCIGVQLTERGPDPLDKHIVINLLIEDDENWFESGFSVSSAWIDETIEMLEEARWYMKDHADPDITDGKQYGWKFK